VRKWATRLSLSLSLSLFPSHHHHHETKTKIIINPTKGERWQRRKSKFLHPRTQFKVLERETAKQPIIKAFWETSMCYRKGEGG